MSTVIKKGQSGRLLSRLSTVDLADHLAEARSVIEKARSDATQITTEARKRAAALFEETEKRGFAQGYERGHGEGVIAGHKAAEEEAMAEFRNKHADIVAAIGKAIDEIDEIKKDLRVRAERDLLEFAVDIARKLTFAIGCSSDAATRANLSRAMRMVEARTDVTVLVHPDVLAGIEEFADAVLRKSDASRSVSIEADASQSPGGCVVRCKDTQVDASLDTQVQTLVSLILGQEVEGA